MSILIEGMEMPISPVLFCVHPDGKVFADLEGKWREYKAFPVPPHGRLIDADELLALVYANIALLDSTPGRLGADQRLVRAWLASIADDINDVPTIIEAEEGET